MRLFRLKAGGKGINVDTPRKAGGLLQRPVSHCLRCCSLPCIQSPPPPFHPSDSALEFRVEAKLDKWMLMLSINHLLGLIINLTSDSKQTFHLCNFPVSRLHFPFSPPTLRGNFVMHFIYSQRQILIYRGDMAYAAFRVRQSHRTLAATLPSTAEREREGETEGGKREEGRPSC